MRSWSFALATLLLILAVLPAAAQSARLRVAVEAAGAPLAGAAVRAGDAATVSDPAGLAVLALAPGRHRITISHPGHVSAELRLILAAGQDTLVRVSLAEAHAVPAIVVSSTRTERRIEDEPLRIEVVSGEEVEEKVLMTPGDIAMLLNETSGVRVQPTAAAVGGAGIRIQGLSGRYTQVLSDGLPLFGAQTTGLGPLQIPPLDLQQVEVIKGAASALYGSTALGGVVNLISKRPAGAREFLVNQTSRDGTDALLWWEGPERALSYTVLVGVHAQGSEDLDDDGWADLAAYRRFTARPRAFWRGEDGSSLLLTAGTLWELREGGTLPERRGPGNLVHREQLETRRSDGGLTGRWVLGPSLQLTVRGSAARQRHEHNLAGLRERDAHSTALLESALLGASGAHTWVVGAAWQQEAYASYDMPRADYRFRVPALFAQDELDLGTRVVVAGSARLDFHDRYGTFLSPRLSVLFRPAEWTLRASAGSGYFAPGPFTEITEATGLRRLQPWDSLEAERAWSVSFDVGRALGPLELNASAFASRIDDAVQTAVPAPNQLALANADGETRTWGGEVFARWHAHGVHALASYAYLRATEPSPDSAARRVVPLTPRHTAGLVAAYELEERGRLAAELYYIGEQQLDDNPYRQASEPYFLTGVLAEVRLGRARLFANFENLLNVRQTHFDPLVRPARSRYGLWSTEVWAPLEGRVVNAGLRVGF